MILIQTDNLYICKSFLTDLLKEPVHISHWLMNQTQGRRQRILNAGAEGVLDQWQGELGN